MRFLHHCFDGPTCISSQLLGEPQRLQRELPGGGEDEGSGPALGGPALELLKERNEETGSFAGAGPGIKI